MHRRVDTSVRAAAGHALSADVRPEIEPHRTRIPPTLISDDIRRATRPATSVTPIHRNDVFLSVWSKHRILCTQPSVSSVPGESIHSVISCVNAHSELVIF